MASSVMDQAGKAIRNGVADTFDKIGHAMTTGAQRLKNDRNAESQVQRNDLWQSDSEPAVGDLKELVELGMKRAEESRQAFWVHHAEDFFQGISYYDAKQYQAWDAGQGRMMPNGGQNHNPDEIEKLSQITSNVLATKVDITVAEVMAAWPDAWVAPLTDSDNDKRSAQVGSAVTAHAARVTHLRRLLREAVLTGLISPGCFIETCWDNSLEADLGFPQPDGSVAYRRLPVGDISNCILLAIDAYPDPNSSLTGSIHDGAYFIKKSIRSVSYIKTKWGKTVAATCPGDNYGSLRQRLEWLANDRNINRTMAIDATEVTEVWEKPSGQYPKGRFWVYSADGTILWAGWWPYEKKDKYPFESIGYKHNVGSIWPIPLTRDLIDPQVQLNGLDSYCFTRQMWDRPTEYVPDGSNIAPEDLLSPSLGRTVGYTTSQVAGGGEPKWVQPPAPGTFYEVRRKDILTLMDMICPVRDLNDPSRPPAESGYQYELWIQTNRTRIGPVIECVAEVVVSIYEWYIALYRQYGATANRLLGLDDKAIPKEGGAASVLMDINTLKEGYCRVVLQEGSGVAKLPAAKEEWLEKFMELGAKGVPPPLLEFWLQQSQWIRYDNTTDKLLTNYTAWVQQEQQQALALQQMKGDQSQHQAQQKAEQEQQQANIDIAAKQQESAIQVHAGSLQEQFRMQVDQANDAARAKNTAMIEQLKFTHAMQLAEANRNPAPKVTIGVQVKPGSIALPDIERKYLGVDPDSAQEVKQMNAPPTPAMAKKPTPKAKS